MLLLHEGELVKTTRFGDPKYVGDPVNAVRIFNEKQVDELVLLDIDATMIAGSPDFDLIAEVAEECRMPLCYGGGIRDVGTACSIVGLGVEKVAMSAAAIQDPSLVTRVAERVGRQSVVVVLDVKKDRASGRQEVWTHNGTAQTGWEVTDLASRLVEAGAGEVVINSIDRDGTRDGYDVELVRSVCEALDVPVTAVGGAGSLEDVRGLVEACGLVGAAAGSLFVFKGPRRAVLINYPNPEKKRGVLVIQPRE